MFKNLNIGVRLSIGFGIVFVLFCALTIFSINRMDYLADDASQIHNHPLTVSNAVLRINANVARIHRSMKDIVLDNSLAGIDKDARLVDGFETKIYADFDLIDKWFLGGRTLFASAHEAFVSWKPIRDEVIGLMRAGNRNEAVDITRGKGAQHVLSIEHVMDELNAFAQGKADEFVDNAKATTDQSVHFMYLLLFFVVVAMMVFTFFLTRSITRPLDALRAATVKIGKGELDVPLDVDEGGELGELAISIREMTDNLSKVIASRDELNREIVERKQAEDKLRNSEARIKLLLESTAEGIYGIDLEGKCTFANPSCLKMLGYKGMDDLLGKNMHNLIHHTRPDGSPYPMHACRIFESFQKGEGTHVDDELLWCQDGTSFASEYWSYPVYEGEQIIGAVVTFMDITERRVVERAHQKLMNDLKEKNAEMERFVYTVSHDLKSPLITIQGFIGFLEKDAMADETARLRSDISHIQNAASQMQELLADLLEISRIGRLVKPPEQVSLNALVDAVIVLLDGQIKACGAQIDVAPDLPMLFGDRKRLLEVVQNLIDNGLKFSGAKAEPRIEIGARREKNEWVCYVKDNGIGIEPRFHNKVFELFERLDSSVDGTGIGLAIVKRIVDLEGGRIWVESEGEGLGSTFCFVLPEKELRI